MNKKLVYDDDYYDPECLDEFVDDDVDNNDDDDYYERAKLLSEEDDDGDDGGDHDDIDVFEKIDNKNNNDDNEDDDENDDLTPAGDSYESFEQGKVPKKEKLPMNGAAVRDRFFKIMEDYHSGDPIKREHALEKAIDELKGFIYHIIKKSYSTYAKDNFMDLLQEGRLGIMVGMQKYDPNKSMPTTFFAPYIKHEMQNLITKQVDKTTAHYSSNIKKITHVIEMFDEAGTPYTNVDLAIQTGLSLETVNQAMTIKSYREEVHIDGCPPGVIDDKQISNNFLTPEEEYIEKEKNDNIYSAIYRCLNEQEIRVLELHFGINDTDTISEGEIAKQMGIPKDKVKKLINSSLRKLKDSSLRNEYRDNLADEDELIEKTELSFIPQKTIDTQLDLMQSIKDVDF